MNNVCVYTYISKWLLIDCYSLHVKPFGNTEVGLSSLAMFSWEMFYVECHWQDKGLKLLIHQVKSKLQIKYWIKKYNLYKHGVTFSLNDCSLNSIGINPKRRTTYVTSSSKTLNIIEVKTHRCLSYNNNRKQRMNCLHW